MHNPVVLKSESDSKIAGYSYILPDKINTHSRFTEIEREIIKSLVSQNFDCSYCIAEHTMQLCELGLTTEQASDLWRGISNESMYSAIISTTKKVMEQKGCLSQEDLLPFIKSGYTKQHLCELCALIAQATLNNLYNQINDTDFDIKDV